MSTPVKSELDYYPSDDDPSKSLPRSPTDDFHVDDESDEASSTDEPIEEHQEVYEPMIQPPSPSIARKRGLDEVFQKSQVPVLSTTPSKTPPKTIAFPYRSVGDTPRPGDPFSQALDRPALSSLRNVMSAESPSPSTGTTAVEHEPQHTPVDAIAQKQSTFVEDIHNFEKCLDADFKEFEQQLESRDKSAELDTLDWSALEQRFISDLDPLVAEEDMIRQQLSQRLQVWSSMAFTKYAKDLQQFLLWTQVSSEKEGERAIKRYARRLHSNLSVH
jgi:hypothetical protein